MNQNKKITRLNYCQYLLSSQKNFTLTNYAEHVDGLSHDTVNRYLLNESLSPKLVWEHVKSQIIVDEEGVLIFDDTVLDKNSSNQIEPVKWQYSGNAGKVIKGIGLVNCIYVNPKTEQFWVIDYRIYDKDCDGKSKLDHFIDMFKNTIYSKKIPFKIVLMDKWYSSNRMFLAIHNEGKIFYSPIPKNRLLKENPSEQQYKPINTILWNDIEKIEGKTVRLKNLPSTCWFKLYFVTVNNHRTEFVITNDPNQTNTDDTQQVCAIRWKVEQFHRELKQLTGIENCECRKQRIQRNHIACSMLVWLRLKQIAYLTKQSVYNIKHQLLRDYLILELKHPRISMDPA